MRAALNIFSLAATIISCAVPAAAVAADDPAARIQSIEQSIVTAGKLFRDKKFDEAAAALGEAKASFEALAATDIPDSLRPQVDTLQDRLTAAERAIAKRKGSAVAKKRGSDAPASGQSAKAKKQAKSKKTAKAAMPAGAVPPPPSFTSDVAPILMARCGNCHIRAAQGGLSMASFEGLAKGSRNGPVINPGASQASRLVEVIFSGAMPRGGGQVSPDELTVISLWIDAGARFDGGDPTAPLGQPALGMMPAGRVAGNGPQSVQFVRDLAPPLVASCIDCHGGDQPAGQLSLESFDSLSKGGKSGAVIVPGKPADSLLIKRLRGLGGDRMPKEKPPLSSQTIGQFEAWIAAGARFDGVDTTLPLKLAVEKSAAGRMSHDELTAKHLAEAERIWALASPNAPAEQLQTANFILCGNVSPDRLAEVARLAEAERAKIVKLLKLDGDAPLVKGRLALFVLKQTSDYSDFVRLVEQREAPRGANGHSYAKGTDVHAALVAASGRDDILPAMVAEQIAGGFLLSLSNVPPWFAAGAARTIAARVEPKSPLVKKWDAEIQSLPAAEGADAFLDATVFDPAAVAPSYAFVRTLTQKLPLFQSLVAALGEERDFDQSLSDIYRHDARALVELWRRRKPSGRG